VLQVRENRSFTVRFSVLVGGIAAVLLLVLRQIPLDLGLSGVVTFLFKLGTLAYFVSLALNRRMWRWRIFSWFLRIPDFSGRWEGWVRSTHDGIWRPSAHEISQKALDIDVEGFGMTNWARGTCSAIDRTGDELTPRLIWAYGTKPTTGNYKGGDTHEGVHILRLVKQDGKDLLRGRYINDRPRDDGSKGMVGEVRLARVEGPLQHDLNFREDDWGLEKPSAESVD